MKRRKLGCLTTGGLVALILTLIVVGSSYAFTRAKLFSPGELNAQSSGKVLGGATSHADLNEDCASCHPAPWDRVSMAARCVECHRDVLDQLTDLSSLHGAVMAEMDDLNCRQCHTEHHGATASMNEFLRGDFPHEMVGFSLKAHSRISWERDIVCEDCHSDGFTTFDQTVCITCHEQVHPDFMNDHVGLFGNACRECHDGIETYGADFDHDRAAFKLEYLHTTLDCGQCHEGAASMHMLMETPNICEGCHLKDDVHQEQLGNQCGVCHTPEGWELGKFDHSATGFALKGGHKNLECLDCHADRTYQGNDPACISCHAKDEPHNGQFGTDCGLCHTINRWNEITFDHSGVVSQDCNACHITDRPANHYPGICSACHSTNAWKPATFDHGVAGATDCISCHSGAKPRNHYSGQCSACHSTNAWKPATFNHSAAGATDCISCHNKDKPSNHYSAQCSACHNTNAWKPANFNHQAAGATDCISCHSGNRPNNHFSGQCSMCHNTNAWKPASFKHSFPLNHGGANQQCTLCHPSNNYNSYTCYGCHEHTASKMQEKHKEVKNFSNNCVNCHAGGKGGDD
jgi:hypothetical protein